MQTLLAKCDNQDTLKAVNTHISAAVSVLKVMQSYKKRTLQVKNKYPPNKNSEKQIRFFSTKKKRQATSLSLTKPSLEEVKAGKEKLQAIHPHFCGICLKEEDRNTRNEQILWIQCSECSMWAHVACTNINLDSLPNKYTCEYCLSI